MLISSSNIERVFSKEDILRRVSQEDIFRFYLNIIPAKGFYHSPFRVDTNPSCTFYYDGRGVLMFKDHTTGQQYDCFNVVQTIYGLNNFSAVLNRVVKDLDLIGKLPKCQTDGIQRGVRNNMTKSNQSKIKIEARDWRDYDLIWWNQFGITENTLKKYNVYPVKKSYLNDSLKYVGENQADPCYAYYFRSTDSLKLYRPLNKRFKWLSDVPHTELQGAEHVKLNQTLIVTKSLKDVMTLHEAGFNAVAVQSETSSFPDKLIEIIHRVYESGKQVFILFDNDDPGMKAAQALSAKWNIPMIVIPKESGCKDSSDYAKENGLLALQTEIEHATNHF